MKRGIPGLLLLLAVFAAWFPAVNGGFVWDDILFVNDLAARDGSGAWRYWFSPEGYDYLPLTQSSLWLEWQIWGRQPIAYHVTNMLLHAVGCILLWRVLLRLNAPGAWLGALIFAAHPVGAASVAWISERKNTLSLVFFAATLLAYLKYEDTREAKWHWGALGAFLLALLSKTSVVMLSLILLGVVWLRGKRITWRDIRLVAPFFALSLIMGLVTVWFQAHRAIGQTEVAPEGFFARLAAAGWSLWFYFAKAFMPLHLAAVYPRWRVEPLTALAFIPSAGVAAGLAWLWFKRKSWGPWPLAAAGFCMLSLLPALGFINMYYLRFSFVADQWQYLALIGSSVFLGGILARAINTNRPWRRRWAILSAAAIVASFMGLAWQRAVVFHDNAGLWRNAVVVSPRSWAAHNGMAEQEMRRNRFDSAEAHVELALRLNRKNYEAYYHRGLIRINRGEIEAGVADMTEATNINPRYALAYFGRGNAHYKAGRLNEAIAAFTKALELDPGYGHAYNSRGAALCLLGDLDGALRDLDAAVKCGPPETDTYLNRAWVHGMREEYEASLADCNAAVALAPDSVKAYKQRGLALLHLARFKTAVADFNIAIKLNPHDPESFEYRALCRYNLGDRAAAMDDVAAAVARGGNVERELVEAITAHAATQ